MWWTCVVDLCGGLVLVAYPSVSPGHHKPGVVVCLVVILTNPCPDVVVTAVDISTNPAKRTTAASAAGLHSMADLGRI